VYKTLLLETPADGVAMVTLDRPQSRNALNLEMQGELDAVLRELATDDGVRAVVLTGAGDKAFSAGYDIHEMQTWSGDTLLLNQLRRESWLWNVATHPKPLIGAINGFAHGAGAIIATALDIRVGVGSAEFRFTAASYGGANNTWQLPQVVGWAKAKEFLMTARRINAQEALQAGLLNHVVSEAEVRGKAIEIASQIAAHPPEGVRWHKALLHSHLGRGYEERYRAENAVMNNELRPRPPAEVFAAFRAAQSHS